MQLGAFSVSLAVKDIKASVAFYEKLGFTRHVGDLSQNWQVMKNGDAVIGLFQGMFEKNSLTFNPGWNQDAQAVAPFTDVREIQQQLKETGVEFLAEADLDTTGAASFVVVDPDGNPVIVDQHVQGASPRAITDNHPPKERYETFVNAIREPRRRIAGPGFAG